MSKAPDRCPMCGEKSLITNTKFSRYAVCHTGYDCEGFGKHTKIV